MTSQSEIEAFLKEFKTKMEIWPVLFRDDRGKNSQALAILEITAKAREKILQELTIRDYSEGPKDEKLYGGSAMWIFGKMIKKQEVYIKITLGAMGSSVICISFHLAEYKMNYPFK